MNIYIYIYIFVWIYLRVVTVSPTYPMPIMMAFFENGFRVMLSTPPTSQIGTPTYSDIGWRCRGRFLEGKGCLTIRQVASENQALPLDGHYPALEVRGCVGLLGIPLGSLKVLEAITPTLKPFAKP